MMNQPYNHELKHRVQDSIKQAIALYIRQSSEKHGIDDILKLHFIAELQEEPYVVGETNTTLRTVNKIPYPIRYINSEPFTYVGLPNFQLPFAKREYGAIKYNYGLSLPEVENQTLYSYSLKNRYIYVVGKGCNKFKALGLLIESIWESPEEIVKLYENNNVDTEDMELPLPYDLVHTSLLTILKTEFNINPDKWDVPINEDNILGIPRGERSSNE
jgi:hypothetical protein